MKKIITDVGKFGPYETVDVLEDRYRVNGAADLPFAVIGQGEISDVVDGDFPPPSTTPSDEQTAEQAQTVREERNTKLSESDWTQVADSPVDKAAWATYRQELRDITAQSGFPWTITWPSAPGA
jgi:hypothetical protein